MVAQPFPSPIDDAHGLIDRARARGSDAREHVAIDAAIDALQLADALTATALQILGRLAPRGGVERVTGLSTELLLTLNAHRPHAEARALTEAAACLRTMPATAEAFARAEIAWPTVRLICSIVRAVDATGRAAVDRMVAAHLSAEPDQVVARVEDEVARLREDMIRAREDRRVASGFLSLQPRLDGQGGSIRGEADAEAFAVICEAIDIASPPPIDDHGPSSRARQRLDGLVALCEQRLAGARPSGPLGPGTRPRPRFLVAVDANEPDGLTARLLWRARGRPGRLSATAIGSLLCDAEIQPVLFDGGRPIAVGDVIGDVSVKARAALIARDQGCRFPGCSMPAAWTDAHHVNGRGPQTTSIDDVILLCRRCHRRVHRHRWKIEVRDDRAATFHHRGVTYLSHPRIRGPARE